jgi:hypothetical protein
MGLPRSTFYDAPPAVLPDDGIVARIGTICDEFECYGYRRVKAALRHQGVMVNGKKLRRLMREHDLQPKQRRRYVVTTDSDHAGPIFPDLAKGAVPDRPNQLWVADLTYVAIPGGFVYLAAILDAWSWGTRSAAPWMPASPSRHRRPPSGTVSLKRAAFTTPIGGRNLGRTCIARCWPPMAWRDQ